MKHVVVLCACAMLFLNTPAAACPTGFTREISSDQSSFMCSSAVIHCPQSDVLSAEDKGKFLEGVRTFDFTYSCTIPAIVRPPFSNYRQPLCADGFQSAISSIVIYLPNPVTHKTRAVIRPDIKRLDCSAPEIICDGPQGLGGGVLISADHRSVQFVAVCAMGPHR